MGTPANQLQLMFDNQKLEDEHRALKSYNITRDSTIELVIGRKYVIEIFTHVQKQKGIKIVKGASPEDNIRNVKEKN